MLNLVNLCLLVLVISTNLSATSISVRKLLFGVSTYQSETSTTIIDVLFTNNNYSSYIITVNNITWLTSGFIGFRNNNNWFTTQNKLLFNSTKQENGEDGFGQYKQLKIIWNEYDSINQYATIIRQYPYDPELILFIQLYLNDVQNTTTFNKDATISAFPSFILPETPSIKLGYTHWSGLEYGGFFDSQYGQWNHNNSSSLSGGIVGSGPLAIFDTEMNNCIIISSLSNPMAMNEEVIVNKNIKQIQWGLQGNINNVNKGFETSFIMSVTKNKGNGLNKGMNEWGDRMLKYFGIKERNDCYKKDYTLNWLGYLTDNGAYYYYYTEAGKNYQDTIIDIKKYHDEQNITTRWIMLDSWWYYQGINRGTTNWTARPDIFPNGMKFIYDNTGWKVQAHQRYFALDNIYANNIPNQTNKETIGLFPFTWSDHEALPLTYSFYDYLFNTTLEWGVVSIEQDWLLNISMTPLILNSTSFGMQWLLNMDSALNKYDYTLKMDSGVPRHLLASVQLITATQGNANMDYHQDKIHQWKLGISSILFKSLGLGPMKDTFWSTSNYPDSGPYTNGTQELYPRLQSVVSSLSNGGVLPGDKINYANGTLIMKCCNSNGLLLRPDVSATMIDKFFLYKSNLLNDNENYKGGEIWSSYSQINIAEYRYIYVFTVELVKDLYIYPNDLKYNMNENIDINNQSWLVYESNNTNVLEIFDVKHPLNLKATNNDWDFQLYTLIPLDNMNQNGWYLMGEIYKWIKVSKQRFVNINSNVEDQILEVIIIGIPNEIVNVGFVKLDTLKTVIISCKIDETQKMIITMPDATCKPV
eukprot:252503_1